MRYLEMKMKSITNISKINIVINKNHSIILSKLSTNYSPALENFNRTYINQQWERTKNGRYNKKIKTHKSYNH